MTRRARHLESLHGHPEPAPDRRPADRVRSPLVKAGREQLCFRASGSGEKADDSSLLACILDPGHEGDCIFGNDTMIAKALDRKRGHD